MACTGIALIDCRSLVARLAARQNWARYVLCLVATGAFLAGMQEVDAQTVQPVPPAPPATGQPGATNGQTAPQFGGSGAPAATAAATFDSSTAIVPPHRLPIIDRYIKEIAMLTPQALRAELTTVSITPQGYVEMIPARSEEVDMLLRALRIGPQPPTGQTSGPHLGAEEPPHGITAESVIGKDTRTQITASTIYPFRVIGRIASGCTGTLIGPRHVLTAGHCVYNIENDRWYSNLDFSPGQNGGNLPYGTITWKRALTTTGWTQSHLRDYDYALIVLNQDIGNNNGWLGYGWQEPMPVHNINIDGYPGDKPFGTMWHSFCQLQIIETFRLYYACDTYGGTSGSAAYVFNSSDQSRTTYGVHAYSVDSTGLNGATRITESVFAKLQEWKQNN